MKIHLTKKIKKTMIAPFVLYTGNLLFQYDWWRLICFCRDPAIQLPDLADMQAVQELRQCERFSTVEIRCPKDLFQLRIQQLPTISEVHDLHGLLQRYCPFALLVVHEKLHNIEQAARLIPCIQRLYCEKFASRCAAKS